MHRLLRRDLPRPQRALLLAWLERLPALLLLLRALQPAQVPPLRPRQPALRGTLLQLLQALLVGLHAALQQFLAPLRPLQLAQFAPLGAVEPSRPGLPLA
ncbi:MAG: hypothetical protein WEA28_01160 [Xanthobacteraceae bacterium]